MQWVRELIKQRMLRKDMILSRPPGQFEVFEIKLAKARERGLRIGMAVDGGAANGLWAQRFKHVYPESKLLCIEPRQDCHDELRQRMSAYNDVTIVQTLIGPSDGDVAFFEKSDESSILLNYEGKEWAKKITKPMTTLDSLLTQRGLPDPDMIKLDLQGYELQALEGASRSLEHAEAALIEVSFIELQKGMPRMHEVVAFMAARGFDVYDITALWHRPLDGALAQGDFLFVSRRSALWNG